MGQMYLAEAKIRGVEARKKHNLSVRAESKAS